MCVRRTRSACHRGIYLCALARRNSTYLRATHGPHWLVFPALQGAFESLEPAGTWLTIHEFCVSSETCPASFLHLRLETSMVALNGSAQLEIIFGHRDTAFQHQLSTFRHPFVLFFSVLAASHRSLPETRSLPTHQPLPAPSRAPHLCNPSQSAPMLSLFVPRICNLLS